MKKRAPPYRLNFPIGTRVIVLRNEMFGAKKGMNGVVLYNAPSYFKVQFLGHGLLHVFPRNVARLSFGSWYRANK